MGKLSQQSELSAADSAAMQSIPSEAISASQEARKLRQSYQMAAGVDVKKDRSNMDSCRASIASVLENNYYSVMMGSIIVSNAILVIHETDLKASDTEIPLWVATLSYIFLAVYFIEIQFRLYVYRWSFFRSRWNWIDLLVVMTDCCAEFAKVWAAGDAPSVSILRIFRLARLLRLIAMLSVSNELATMLLGFGSAMRAMVWASFMIGVVLTVCSIVAVEFIHPLNLEVAKTGVYGDCRRCSRAFETVAESNLTFIQQIIAGDSWGKITIPIMEIYPGAGVFFLVVFGLIDLGVLNLILTVIVNAAESAREANYEMQLRGKARQIEEMKNKLKQLCSSLDDNDDGRITLQEFLDGVDGNAEFARTLALLDIQKQDAEIVYRLMDEDASGDVDFNEFVSVMISTKHETEKTKLLFLKAAMNDVQIALRSQHSYLQDHVSKKMLNTKDVVHAVSRALEDSNYKVGLQADNMKAEFDSISRKLEFRWEQLQKEQAKGFRLLEQVVAQASVPPQTPVARGSLRQSFPASLPVLSPCTACEIEYGKQNRIISGYPSPRPVTPGLSGLEKKVELAESRRASTSSLFESPSPPRGSMRS